MPKIPFPKYVNVALETFKGGHCWEQWEGKITNKNSFQL